ncbi:radical SAM protein [Candidatus Woesearchaeota archaeon]|nr:radical SAM protein [Candidatus Woesearchaeota archaeon]
MAAHLDNLSFLAKNQALLSRVAVNTVSSLLGHQPLRTVEIALHYDCQFACNHCSMESMKDPSKKMLSREEFVAFIDTCIDHGAVHFLLTGGEPLLSPDLYFLLGHIKQKKRIATLVSNGFLFTPRFARKVATIGVDLVTVSLDSLDEAEHNAFRKHRHSYARIFKGIEHLRDHGVPTCINFVVRNENVDELPRLYDLSRSLSCSINLGFAAPVGNWDGRDDVLLTSGSYDVVKKYLRKPGVRWCGDGNYLKKGCAAGSQKIYLNPYGDVTPCPLVPRSFGNIRETSFKTIRTSMLAHPDAKTIHEGCTPSIRYK